MKDDRAAILERIHAATRRHTGEPHRATATVPLPSLGEDLGAHFAERAKLLASDVVGPLSASKAPGTIANYLETRNLSLRAVCWPTLATFDWKSAGIEASFRAAKGDDLVGITGAFCAIAETGTLMLLSEADTPSTVSLLPETHVALLPVSRIVPRMEDAWSLLRREHGSLPRAVNFVSGPSRTADIEQTITLGAHGPYRVLIVLID